MKKLFIIIFDQLKTDSESFSWGLYVSSAHSSWFTGEKQGILTFFFFVVEPLYEQFFDWNCCVDMGSEGKIWKSFQNSLLTLFFTWKIKINHLFTWNIPFSWQTVDIFRPFQVSGKNVLIKNKVHTCVFKKITKIYYTFAKKYKK